LDSKGSADAPIVIDGDDDPQPGDPQLVQAKSKLEKQENEAHRVTVKAEEDIVYEEDAEIQSALSGGIPASPGSPGEMCAMPGVVPETDPIGDKMTVKTEHATETTDGFVFSQDESIQIRGSSVDI
jgi:hypothetical protein